MTIRVANTDFRSRRLRRGRRRALAGGHAVRYGSDGEIVGITIVDARRLLDENGAIRITLPETISAADLRPALARA